MKFSMIHENYNVSDLARSLEFYRQALGLEDGPQEERVIFSGNARDAIAAFPKNVNVAVAAAFASCGMQDTTVEVHCRPGLALNTHRVELEGDFGRAAIEVASRPSADNPRSSALAADSVVACLQNLAGGIVF